ncbi:MAG: complex I NDUFA9 subunit family protein [Paracoccaceae bacterium]
MAGGVTVLGATGFLGGRAARRLMEDGHLVRVVSRRPERDRALMRWDRATPVAADLTRPESLPPALEGAEAALNAASLYRETDGLTFEAIHVDGAARFAAAARQAGVRRLVHVSGIGADAGAGDPYVRARGRGEAAVRDAFPGATIVRPSVMFGPDDAFLSAILAAIRRLPVVPLFGSGRTRLQPVHVDDAARAMATALQAEAVAPVHELGGPTVWRYRDLVHAVGKAAGRTVRTAPVPFALWRAFAAAAERLPEPPLTRTEVALMEADKVAAPDLPGTEALGVRPRDAIAYLRRLPALR